MRYRRERQHTLSRRAFLLGSASVLGFGVLAARFGYLQLTRGSSYGSLAEGNRVRIRPVPPLRGDILAFNGDIIAENRSNYRLVLEPDTQDATESLDALARLLPASPEERESWRELWHKRQMHETLQLAENLTYDQVARLEFAMPRIPGAAIEVGQVRAYPLAELAGHLTGYVGRITEKNLTDLPDDFKRLTRTKIGQNGLEKANDVTLRGSPGVRQLEVNVRGLALRELRQQPPKTGNDLHSTIDARLQRFIAERLGEESGAVVCMHADTGGIRAFVSMPGFDPNRFSLGIGQTYWNSLRDDKRSPLLNKAVAGIYPPGSTFKMLTGIAGLHHEVTKPSTRVHCPGYYYVGRQRFRCWKIGGHGSVDLHRAIAESCDTYFYHVGNQLGIERMAETCRDFAVGQDLGLNFPGMRTGLMPTPEWKQRRFNQSWSGGDTVNASIGQGFVLMTPLQLATMTARLATGRDILPQLEHREAEGVIYNTLGYDPVHLDAIRNGMSAAVNKPYGTAYGKRLAPKFAPMAGKTGTAQVRRITTQGQDQSTIPWEQRHHALFVCYAPLVDPRYVVSVVIDHGGGGGSAAAPVAKDVMEFWQNLTTQDEAVQPSPSEEAK